MTSPDSRYNANETLTQIPSLNSLSPKRSNTNLHFGALKTNNGVMNRDLSKTDLKGATQKSLFSNQNEHIPMIRI